VDRDDIEGSEPLEFDEFIGQSPQGSSELVFTQPSSSASFLEDAEDFA